MSKQRVKIVSTYDLLQKEMTKLEKLKKPSNPPVKKNKQSSTSSITGCEKANDKKSPSEEKSKPSVPKDPNMPDRSYGDFFCNICDSHMNSDAMWEAHVTGKRHLKNLKKGDVGSKYEDLDVESSLKYELRNVKDPVVGLSYIHEIRRREPNIPPFYNCFLCHASIATIPLLIEHVISFKHRLNYVKENDRAEFELLEATDLKKGHLEPLVHEAALKLEQKYGRGEVKVKQEKPKKVFPIKRTFKVEDSDSDDNHQKPIKKLRSDKHEPDVWKTIDSLRMPGSNIERSQNDREKESYHLDDEFPVKKSFNKFAPIKRDVSPSHDESYPRSYSTKFDSDNYSSQNEYDDYLWQSHLNNKKHCKSSELKSRSPSEEYYPNACPLHSEYNLLPHEILKNETKSSTSDASYLKDFLQKVFELPTEISLKIFLIKMENMDIKGTEELSLLSKIIVKAQVLLYKKLPTELQTLMKQKYQNSAAPSTSNKSVLMAPVLESNMTSSGLNTNQPLNPQNHQSDISFIRDILKSVKSANSSASANQSVSSQQHINSFQNASPLYNKASYSSAPSQNVSAPLGNYSYGNSQLNLLPGKNYPCENSQSNLPSGKNYLCKNSQSNLPSGGNYSYKNSQSNLPSGGNYSYKNSQSSLPSGGNSSCRNNQSSLPSGGNSSCRNIQSVLPSGIPGLTLTENENPQPQSYNNYQTAYSPTKSYATQNYPYKY